MDNFMDKLAQRFNAGELITANAAAEEHELQSAKERAAENDKIIQELRRLNLKNVELTEQVQQLIRCGIEQFEEYSSVDTKEAVNNEALQQLEEKFSSASDKAEKAFSNSQKMADNSINAIEDYKMYLEEFAKMIENLRITTEETKSASLESKRTTDSIEKSSSEMKKEVLIVKDLVSSLKTEMNQLKDKLVKKDDSSQDVTELQNSIESQLRQISLCVTSLEEHVHKENVKVYRNVQAVVNEQATQKARELGDRLDGIERSQKSMKRLMALSFLTLLTAIASLVMQFM